jgi:hypothetical protein
VVSPLDVLKIRFQTQNALTKAGAPKTYDGSAPTPAQCALFHHHHHHLLLLLLVFSWEAAAN